MRRALAIIAASAMLASCGRASASEPDSHNPVHCIAAITYQMVLWDKVGGHPEQMKEGAARAMAEDRRAKATGLSSEDVKAEMSAFTKANRKKPGVMRKLAADCLVTEDADPVFQRQKRKNLAFLNGDPF
jgi:hypothetical protein